MEIFVILYFLLKCIQISLSLFVNIISWELVYLNSLIVKENRGGFFERIDVDLLVSSMNGATIMKSIQEENIEYDKFVIGLAHKVQKIQQDFNKLSDENKIRFENDVTRAITAKGIVGVSEYFNQWK